MSSLTVGGLPTKWPTDGESQLHNDRPSAAGAVDGGPGTRDGGRSAGGAGSRNDCGLRQRMISSCWAARRDSASSLNSVSSSMVASRSVTRSFRSGFCAFRRSIWASLGPGGPPRPPGGPPNGVRTRHRGAGRTLLGRCCRGPPAGRNRCGSLPQSRRRAPRTLPRICASSPGIGEHDGVRGMSHTCPSCRRSTFTLALSSRSPATRSPWSALSGCPTVPTPP